MKILVRFLGFFCPQKKRTKKSRHQDGIVLTVPDDLCYDCCDSCRGGKIMRVVVEKDYEAMSCLLYTSDAADEL